MTNMQKVIKYGAIALAAFIILSIVNGILWLVFSLTDFSEKEVDFNETFKDVLKLDIDLSASNLEIKKGEVFSVDAVDVTSSFKAKMRGDTLVVRESTRWFFGKTKAGSIVITVPDLVLKDLDIDAGAGVIKIDDIKADALELDQGAGTVEIINSMFNKTKIDGGAGKVTVENSTLNNLDLNAGVGKIDIRGIIHGNSEIDCGVGELNLELLDEEENYKLLLDKGIGSITLNGSAYNNNTYGTGLNKIDIDGGVGSLNINFNR